MLCTVRTNPIFPLQVIFSDLAHSPILDTQTFIMFRSFTFSSASGRRAFSALSLRTWRSFEDARTWARAQGFRRATEWSRCGPQRPPDIPSEPWRVYADKYIDIRDWLGVGPESRPIKERHDKLASYSDRQEVHRLGAEAAEAAIHGERSEFEIFRMPYFSPVTFLFRPHGTASDQWAALAVKGGASTAGGNGRLARQWFCLCRDPQLLSFIDYSTLCLDVHRGDMFFFGVGEISASTVALKRGGQGKHDGRHVLPTDVPKRLRIAYDSGPLRSISEWLVQSAVWAPGGSNMIAIAELWCLLWTPCHINVSFSIYGTSPSIVALNDKSIVLRSAAADQTKAAWGCKFSRSSSRRTVPFSVDDDFEFLLVTVGKGGQLLEGEPHLRGCFLFPKSVLAARGKIAAGDTGGVEHLLFYPPFVSPRRCRGTQVWQSPFYIDVDDRSEQALEASRIKFLNILSRAGGKVEDDGSANY